MLWQRPTIPTTLLVHANRLLIDFVTCPQCGGDLPPGMKFCGHCGARLDVVASAPELRQLTVMFCDLVGSTSLAERLDPEELRELTGEYHAVCSRVIEAHDGHVAQYLGDGLLVYFGHPMAHEDDAQRAIRTGLGIQEGLARLAPRIREAHGVDLLARIGIHTGNVVIGEVGHGHHREQLALGMAPNVAARVQDLAEVGTVTVTEATHALALGHFDFEPIGSHEFRGLTESIAVFTVVRERAAGSAQERLRHRRLTRLTGRSAELEALVRRWERASRSGLAATLIAGEAGIGKSRIVDALRRRVGAEANVLECSSSPYHRDSALYPIITLIERELGLTGDRPAEEKLAVIDDRLESRGLLMPEARMLMARLLSIPLPEGEAVPEMSAPAQRDLTLQILRAWLFAIAEHGPVLWIFEDLHWTDSTTLELLGTILASDEKAPLLMVLTHRPEFVVPWPAGDAVETLNLERLSDESAEAMVRHVAGGKALPADVMSRLIVRAEGVPLFVEEVTKAVLETGILKEHGDRYELIGPLPSDLIPATVQGSLNARLDRLGNAKRIAQIAATIGREFRYDVLSAVAGQETPSLRTAIDRLIDTELVFRDEAAPNETYLFKHALIQDAAYQSLLRRTRRELHARIGDALSALPEIAASQPDLLAQHYSAADQQDRAVPLWVAAVQQAAGRAAYYEVAAHCRNGLAAIVDWPEDDRLGPEIEFLTAIIPALQLTIGWASGELKQYYDRSKELVGVAQDPMQRFRVGVQTFTGRFCEGHCTEALLLAERLPPIAETLAHDVPLYMAHMCLAVAQTYEGFFEESLVSCERSISHVTRESDPIILSTAGISGRSYHHSYRAENLWALGYPDQALAASATAIANARAIGHPGSMVHALGDSTHFLPHFGDPLAVLTRVDETLEIAREMHSTWWGPYVGVYQGWAFTIQGRFDEGIDLMRSSLARYLAGGNGTCQSHMRACLATGLMRAGRWDEAIDVLSEARAIVDEIGERYFEAELYRIEADALISRSALSGHSGDDLDAAQARVLRALELARERKAKSHELRAAMCLCRLQRQSGDPSQAREVLEDVFGWFTEGFETRDLLAARALLDELSP